MSMSTRPIRSDARPTRAALALLLVLGLVLAACGGGGGGGGGNGTALKLRVAVVNETTGDIDVSLDAASGPGTPEALATCTAKVFTLDLPDEDWMLTVNGQTAIDSLNLEPIQEDKNLIAEVNANEDGTVTLESLQPGALMGVPAQAGICN
jgi:hypothetical protein